MSVDVFLNKNFIRGNLRSTAVQQNHAKPLLDPKFWREREREREEGGLKRSAHIAMQFLVLTWRMIFWVRQRPDIAPDRGRPTEGIVYIPKGRHVHITVSL